MVFPIIGAAVGVVSAISSITSASSARKQQRELTAQQLETLAKEKELLIKEKAYATTQASVDFTRAKALAKQDMWTTIHQSNLSTAQSRLSRAQADLNNQSNIFNIKQARSAANVSADADTISAMNSLSDGIRQAQQVESKVRSDASTMNTAASTSGQSRTRSAGAAQEASELAADSAVTDSIDTTNAGVATANIDNEYARNINNLQSDVSLASTDAQEKLNALGSDYAASVNLFNIANARTTRRQYVNALKANKQATLYNIATANDAATTRNSLSATQVSASDSANRTGSSGLFSLANAATSLGLSIYNQVNPVRLPTTSTSSSGATTGGTIYSGNPLSSAGTA
jgi:hypothetical protein